ncbi:MAG: methylmalonyl-CoA mutase family protein [Verrucomicrobiota bacterium]
MSQTKPLTLDEFPIPSYEDWKAEAVASLKGAPFEKKLITRTLEGIEIQPIYRKEDLEKVSHLGSLPGEAPYVRGTKTTNKWEIYGDGGKCTPPMIDPIFRFVRGVLEKPLDASLDEIATAESVGVNTLIYHNAGGNAVQELAFGLATGVEYLRQGEKRGVSIDAMAQKLTFSFAMGADFFMAIAKLRAARLLWSKIVAACGGNADSQKMRIYATTSRWNQSKLDPYVNMLRDTTEALSAVAGGADIINVNPFDAVVREPDEFSKRIARNTQLILAEECHFDHVVDPGGGSYYIETLTAQLAEAAWTLFQQVEQAGGMIKALEAGIPQKQVKAVAAKKAEQVAQRRLSLIGVNVYANATEKPLEGKAPKCCCAGEVHVPSNIETLAPVRGAEPFENLRAAVNASAKKKIFLANMGPLRQHKARADFSTGFFQAGGYEVLENRGFQTADEAAAAAIASGASVAVICSTDDTYPEIVPALAPKLKAAGLHVVLAGYPTEHIEAFQQAGVGEFIHIRANCFQVLSGIATKLGIF